MTSYIYQDKIFCRLNAGILSIIVILLIFILVYQRLVDPVRTDTAPDWFFILMILLFTAVGVNFSTLIITIDYENITVGYALIKKKFQDLIL